MRTFFNYFNIKPALIHLICKNSTKKTRADD
ncbi:hypothetical protein MPC4_960002 [Methylocella tundrae]|uniref:Uncharacterized protein n=1 Tax=Methylocella tundrae TaxID=227605 RepID=A0A8B6MCH9_METTU|nr:hypothetical protein MPC4_960002 [Methylocella tundrae]